MPCFCDPSGGSHKAYHRKCNIPARRRACRPQTKRKTPQKSAGTREPRHPCRGTRWEYRRTAFLNLSRWHTHQRFSFSWVRAAHQQIRRYRHCRQDKDFWWFWLFVSRQEKCNTFCPYPREASECTRQALWGFCIGYFRHHQAQALWYAHRQHR